jgi:hypothetical protein
VTIFQAALELIEVRLKSSDRQQDLRHIVRAGCSEYFAHRVYDLPLLAGESSLLRSRRRDV